MQLRPSGKAGPVAVSINRFEGYYPGEAWTWEMMALTRARVVAGDDELARRVEAAIRAALTEYRDGRGVREDALSMRKKLEEAKPAKGIWDLKARAGGIQDIEFIAQTLQLIHAPRRDVLRPPTKVALRALQDAGALNARDAAVLTGNLELYLGLLQMLRSAHGSGFDPATASAGFAERLAGLAGLPDLDALALDLEGRTQAVRKLFRRLIGKI